MKRSFPVVLIGVFSILWIFSTLSAQGFGGDLLNEAPLSPLPGDMSYEEYVDMNRRVSMGLMLSAIPCPGMMHSYAGDAATARNIRIKTGIGLAVAIGGALLSEEGDFPDSDFQVHVENAGQDNERRFEMVPVGMDGSTVQYEAREMMRESSGAGMLLVPIGLGYVAWQYIRDYYYGVKMIEEKRNRVRYKYGIRLQPRVDMKAQSAGLGLVLEF